MPRRILALAAPAAAIAALAAVPATGSASTIVTDRACYTSVYANGKLSYQPITVAVGQANPNTKFMVYGVGGRANYGEGVADAAGNGSTVVTRFSVPGIKPSKGRTITLAVTEFPVGGKSGDTGAVNVKATTLALDLSNKPRAAYSRRTWTMSGLTPLTGSRSMYASWYRGSKLVKRTKLGTANECGYLRVKRSAFPSRKYRKLTLRVHSQKTWSKDAPYLKMTVRVFRRYF
ncbi:hypothetical protein [Patulibacter sp. SYSU D01012]|uniref:hypothetical protein n=1 Tax=Patulibacter sp. SYSU D01012 TaxID=2817381 RepID=UPI001B30065C|nr:hypothetical protein [Patulibacter sp. SYSU D01012]